MSDIQSPSSSTHPLIDPFAVAQIEPGIHVAIRIDDVVALRPQTLPYDASRFLDTHATVIAAAMLMAGLAMTKHLLEVHHES